MSGIRGPVVLERHEELEPQVPLGALAGPGERSPHVVPLRDNEVVTHLTLDVRCETRRERDEEVVLRVPSAKRTLFALGSQLLCCELTDRLEHPVTRTLVLTPPDETLVEQRLQRVGVTVAHGLRGLECAAAGEHGERAEKTLLLRLEQVVRPLDRRAQRLLTRIGVSAPLEQVETLGEPLHELLRREHDGAGGCEFERKRQIVQARTKLAHGLRRAYVGVDCPCPAQEQLDAFFACERRHRIDVLALELEALPAGDDQCGAGDVAKLRDPRRHVGHEMFGVVEHEQCALSAETRRQALFELLARLLFHGECLCDGGGHEPRVAERRQRHPPDAVGKRVRCFRSRVDREPRLARATGAGERDEPGAVL